MHGVSIPSHRYAAIASNFLQPNSTVDYRTVQELSAACRAFTRVVLRLRCQAEAEAAHNARVAQANGGSVTSLPRVGANGAKSPPAGYPPYHSSNSAVSLSRNSSRVPSPASSYSNLHGAQSRSNTMPMRPGIGANGNGSGSLVGSTFQSPLFRLRRAPLLKVFVPSPDGDWLSDASVLECEAELRRAGVLHLLRAGDVVWDVAAGDESNVGRLVWDGSYLIVSVPSPARSLLAHQLCRTSIIHTREWATRLDTYPLLHSLLRTIIVSSVPWERAIPSFVSTSHPGETRS